MFRDSLLESSSARRNGKRWPMAMAFVAEAIVASVLVLIPLFSSGIIPASARVPAAPLHAVALADHPANSDPGPHPSGPRTPTYATIAINNNPSALPYGRPDQPAGPDEPIGDPPYSCIGNCVANALPDFRPSSSMPKHEDPPKRRPSVLSEGLLLRRVEPIYPRPASIIRLQGVVKLQAVISKDGTIQSLNVISGHPLLVSAAVDAVRQWRYRPYILNGEPVEVDTFITVNFKHD